MCHLNPSTIYDANVNNIRGVKITSRQDYFIKELKTKNNIRKNSKRSLQASYLHDKALQNLFRGDNRVSKLYNCSNKPVNASEEQLVSEYCTSHLFLFECIPMFILYHQHSARWSGLFNYFLLCRILGGGVENLFVGVDILFGGGAIANIGGGGSTPPHKICLCSDFRLCYSLAGGGVRGCHEN